MNKPLAERCRMCGIYFVSITVLLVLADALDVMYIPRTSKRCDKTIAY